MTRVTSGAGSAAAIPTHAGRSGNYADARLLSGPTTRTHPRSGQEGRETPRFGTGKDVRKPSMRRAINAKCKECIYDPIGGSGNWRQQVEACTVTGCPLYPLRPVSRAGG